MARIDTGAIATEARWAHPSEIVAAARDQVEHTLHGHHVEVTVERDIPVHVDPRLTAAAFARLLENAAQYAPAGTTIHVGARVTGEGLELSVRDHGPGLAASDLPRLFDRYYRGSAAGSRASGTGMGLWIARELLADERGQVWAENQPDGGARFTILVSGAAKEADREAARL
jgi:two-component system sensor histidine kinase KdpD